MGYKIIELEIDDNILSGQTGVDSVAFVEMPAIETEFMYFGRQKFYKAPDYVAQKACQAIKQNEERGNPAGTQVGKVRAQQLCSQSEISLDTIKRMKSFLERAATYNTGNWDDNGTIAYGLWGGEEALKWVDNVLSQIENQDMDIDVSGLPEYVNYPTGDTKNDMLIKPILFVEKVAGESKNDYLQRCIPVLRTEGYDEDQAVAICIDSFGKCGDCKQSMAEVGERGGIKESDKAPKSDTPNPNPKGEGTAKGDAGTTRGAEVSQRVEDILKKKSDEFNERYKDKLGYGVNVGMLKSVYQRGIGAYNVSHSPAVKSSEQWALARVNAFLYIVKNGRPENSKYVGDNDLLPKEHPKYSTQKVENSKQEFTLLGYMDGIPYFSNPVDAEAYGKINYNCEGHHVHQDEDGNDVYMSCETHGDIPDGGIELESLLEQGWVIEDVKEIDAEELLKSVKQKYSQITEQEFYRIVSDPNENSIQDFAGAKIRYVYVSGMGSDIIATTREFCRRMMGGRQFVFRYEDIMRLNAEITAEDSERTIIPRPVGTAPDIMLYKGGANCRHYWLQLIFGNPNPNQGYEETITNRKYDEIRKAEITNPATGQAGIVNPKANPQRGSRDGFSKAFNNTIIVDIDDTLFDGLSPNQSVVDYVNSKWGNNRIVIITARNQARKIETISQLSRAGVRYDDLFLVESPYNKQKKAKELMQDGLRIVEAIENNPFTGQDYRSLGIMKITNPDSLTKMIPTGFIQGLPVFEDKVMASDYSYANGCGGIVEPVEYMGKRMYQSCSYNSSKKEDFNRVNFSSDDEKRMIYGPLMLPNILIPRMDETTGEKYYVKFKPQTIEKIQRKFMIDGYQRATNLEHTDKTFKDVVLVENWIVSSEQDKIYSLGFTKEQVPLGSWVGGYYVLPTKEGDMIWEELIKTGKVKGFSVEGMFNLKFFKDYFTKTDDDVLLDEIIDILNRIND